MDSLFNAPVVQTTQIAKLFDVSYPTAKKDLKRLQEIGILTELKDAAQKTYVNDAIVHLIFEGVEV